MKKVLLGFSIGILMGVVLLLDGCGTTQEAADTDADIAAIKSLAEQAQDAYVARDWERFAGFFTDDGVWMPPDMAPLVGKEAWWSWVQQWWDEDVVEQMNLSHEEIVVAVIGLSNGTTKPRLPSLRRAASGASTTSRASGYSEGRTMVPGKSHAISGISVRLLRPRIESRIRLSLWRINEESCMAPHNNAMERHCTVSWSVRLA